MAGLNSPGTKKLREKTGAVREYKSPAAHPRARANQSGRGKQFDPTIRGTGGGDNASIRGRHGTSKPLQSHSRRDRRKQEFPFRLIKLPQQPVSPRTQTPNQTGHGFSSRGRPQQSEAPRAITDI